MITKRYIRVEYSEYGTSEPVQACDICDGKLTERHLMVALGIGPTLWLHVECADVLARMLAPMAEVLGRLPPLPTEAEGTDSP